MKIYVGLLIVKKPYKKHNAGNGKHIFFCTRERSHIMNKSIKVKRIVLAMVIALAVLAGSLGMTNKQASHTQMAGPITTSSVCWKCA
jgi:hypothetical protein